MIFTILNDSMLLLVKKPMTAEKGREFYALFRKTARQELTEILPEVPDIGDSIFLSSYWCGVCCIAWYRAFLRLGVDPDEANQWIWRVIERSLQMLPGFLIPFVRKLYLGGMLKKAEPHREKRNAGTLPEYDWVVTCTPVDKECFRLDIHECAIQKLCRKFHAEGLLPSLCRTDYLVAHYLRAGFERTKTLGDGDDICNNTFRFHGECQWMPEKGFVDRK